MRPIPLLIGTVALSACALLGKNEPVVPRYFTPEYDGDAPGTPARSDLQLRLGRVEGWSNVRERMAIRNSAREVFYYEDRRWTERPEIYLRRALSRTLFEERGVVASLSGRTVTLTRDPFGIKPLYIATIDGGMTRTRSSSPGASTRMTSAPRSARTSVAQGPGSNRVRSRTRMPASGCISP